MVPLRRRVKLTRWLPFRVYCVRGLGSTLRGDFLKLNQCVVTWEQTGMERRENTGEALKQVGGWRIE